MRLERASLATGVISCAILGSGIADPALAQELEEVVVRFDLRSLPGEDVQSVFGFGRSILETPRSVSTISTEMMERFNMRDIDELVAVAPGSFTQSFFGVAGSLDVRGTPGETYFRGVRRLDNPGNYPTPIGASDRIDVVRGPASPIYGPSKIGGYLNFNPKSARIESTGQFVSETSGALSVTTGSWDKKVVAAEVGGPATVADRAFGYHLYGELERSDSYYDNSGIDQEILQASFDMDLTDRVRLQFGGMWHDFAGNQIAGWNRLTQALVDHGIYVTGDAQPLDADGSGRVSHQEYDIDGDGFGDLDRFYFVDDVPGGAVTPGSDVTLEELEAAVGDLSAFALVNPGITILDGHRVLVAPEDLLTNDVTTLYFDVIVASDGGWDWTNQLFYESYNNLNENAYGFSQFHDSYVIEDKLIVSRTFARDGMTASLQISPSWRYTDFEHGDDYANEHFGRRDLTREASALARRLLATRTHDDYTEYYIGDYSNWGLAFMGDFLWDNGLNLLAGVRHDTIDMQSRQPVDRLLFASPNNFCPPPGDCARVQASDSVDGVSWTLSLSYASDAGLIPYLTAAEQSTMIVGQGAEVSVDSILNDGAFDQSELLEAGLKGSFLDDDLYFAISAYRQERTDFSAQSIVNNQATETEGAEAELRWSVNERLLLTLGYSKIEVVNLNTQRQGYRFSFLGCDDLPAIPCHALYGGTVSGNVSAAPSGARRAGMPENIYSVTGTYDFGNGLTIAGSVIDVASAPSGYSNSVTLPAYTLVNLAVGYEADAWTFSMTAKNLTDERYFRANFPNLFGGAIVLPELPRHYSAHFEYRF